MKLDGNKENERFVIHASNYTMTIILVCSVVSPLLLPPSNLPDRESR